MGLMKMEDLFKKANLNYVSMEKNIPYDISDFNLKIKSYNHGKNYCLVIYTFKDQYI